MINFRCFFFCFSKQTSIEIEQLNARVVEAETKLKTEVARIKKKLQIQITELEMSLDTANKMNIDLQKTVKKQSLQLTELQAHYDEVNRQFQITLDQLSVAQRKVQALTAEAEEIRGNYEAVREIPFSSFEIFKIFCLSGSSRQEERRAAVRGGRVSHQRTHHHQR